MDIFCDLENEIWTNIKLNMSERNKGIYSLIKLPAFYRSFQDILGGKRARKKLGELHFKEFGGKSVLEVGCGPGTWVQEMPEVSYYLGVDWNEKHIQKAAQEYNSSGFDFICGDITDKHLLPKRTFDVVCAFGIMHHLDDLQVDQLLNSIKSKLTSDGLFLAIEPVYHSNQHWFARLMKKLDSGQNIRQRKLISNC